MLGTVGETSKRFETHFYCSEFFSTLHCSQVINRVENEVPTIQMNQSIVNQELLNIKQHKPVLP